MKRFIRYETIIIVILSLVATLLRSVALVSRFLLRPPEHRFIGVAHYWEDFFYYLDQFYQGAHGSWTIVNKFSTDPQSPTLLYINHLILGKIGGILGLEPFDSYNLSLLIFKFLMIFAAYYLIKQFFRESVKRRLFAFAVFFMSTSIPLIDNEDGAFTVSPSRLFRAANLASSRFGNVPDSLVRNVIFIMLLIGIGKALPQILRLLNEKLSWSKLPKSSLFRIMAFSLLLLFLTLSDPTKTAILLTGLFTALILAKEKTVLWGRYIVRITEFFLLIAIPSIVAAIILFSMIVNNPIYAQANTWDMINHQEQLKFLYTHPQNIFISFGTISILLFVGLPVFLKKRRSVFENICLAIAMISILGYLLPLYKFFPIPGFRFMFSTSYVFFAVIAAHGFVWLMHRFPKIPVLVLAALIFIPNFITFATTFIERATPVKEPFYHFVYLPDDLYQGLLALRRAQPQDAVVLANPGTSLDMLIPGITGKFTYSGHLLMTPEVEKRDKLALEFLYKWTDPNQAKQFMLDNHIRYILWTVYSGDSKQIKRDYPFLTVEYENPMVTIFKLPSP